MVEDQDIIIEAGARLLIGDQILVLDEVAGRANDVKPSLERELVSHGEELVKPVAQQLGQVDGDQLVLLLGVEQVLVVLANRRAQTRKLWR